MIANYNQFVAESEANEANFILVKWSWLLSELQHATHDVIPPVMVYGVTVPIHPISDSNYNLPGLSTGGRGGVSRELQRSPGTFM